MTHLGMLATTAGLFSLTVLNEALRTLRMSLARKHSERKANDENGEEDDVGSDPSSSSSQGEWTSLLLASNRSSSMSSVRRRRILKESKDFEK
jgi:hypothetical protein